MAVGTDHHAAGERVVLEHNLVNDSATGTPKTDAVLGGHTLQEVVHLAVVINGNTEVDLGANFGQDEMVAVNSRWNSGGRKSCCHELQQGHLCGRILHGHAIGIEVGVTSAAHHFLSGWINEVVDQNLFGQREGATKALTAEGRSLGERGIHVVD